MCVESKLSDEFNLVIRQGKRYDNITIGLRCLVDGQWEGFRAIGWNEVGFNFYLDHEIKQIHLPFKTRFGGVSRHYCLVSTQY
jgi:hypothetical protein